MFIIEEKCNGCGTCAIYCPTGAIIKNGRKYYIDRQLCVECNNCFRNQSCKHDALMQETLTYPRTIRNIFSDVCSVAKETGVGGRGTEEMKTNDVTDRIKSGEVIVGMELGRPSVSNTFKEVDKMTRTVFKHKVRIEDSNPLVNLIDLESGKVKEELLEERVMSCIIEVLVRLEDLKDLLPAVIEKSSELETVLSLFVASRIGVDGEPEAKKILEGLDLQISPGGKTNVGLAKY